MNPPAILVLLVYVTLICNDIITHVTCLDESTSTSSKENTAVFYNIFIDPDARLSELSYAMDILQEQLEYRSNSVYPDASLYYISIGKDLSSGIPKCTNCEQIKHEVTGTEVVTLSALHEFCINNPEKTVAYIHNKGSLHPMPENDLLRRMITKAVFSDECLQLKNAYPIDADADADFYNYVDDKGKAGNNNNSCQCNICSARFTPFPHYHTSGNMWVASCSYISNLIPPILFPDKMEQVVNSAPTDQFQGSDHFGAVNEIIPEWVGRGRFSLEHWVHSHPDVCPCDVYSGDFIWGYDNTPKNDSWTPNLVKAPRFASIENYYDNRFKRGRYNIVRTWASLLGRMHEWKTLYGKNPNKKSWVWTFYPQLQTQE